MYDQLARTWFLSFSRRSAEEIRETVHEHMAIVEALEKGRPELAEQAVLHHLERFRSKFAPRPDRPGISWVPATANHYGRRTS